jgi:hypothetical protein
MTTFSTAAEIVAHSFSNDWALRMQERADLAEAVFVAADYFGVHFSEFRGLDGGDPEMFAWHFTAEVLLAMGLDTPQKINARGRALADQRWAAAKAREAERELAQAEFCYHVSGQDGRGAELMDTGFCSDMGLYASMDTLEEAEAWAARQFATDARVQSVAVTIYKRTPSTVGWRFHEGVKTIALSA